SNNSMGERIINNTRNKTTALSFDSSIKSIGELLPHWKEALDRLNKRSYIDLSRSYNDIPCKRWNGTIDAQGYERINYLGEIVYIHRLSALIFYGMSLYSPKLVCHHCDTKNCWEPMHLFPGTQGDNIRDSFNKGRKVPPNS